MDVNRIALIFIVCSFSGLPSYNFPHGGRLNSVGCHNQTSNSTYHCHRGPLAGQTFADHLEAEASAGSTASPPPQAYRREDYLGSWGDEDSDCQNLRHELLIEQSLEDVSFTSSRRCTVKSGRWLDPYSGNVLEIASDLDVDHVVPLSYAHVTGGYSWPISLKQEFAQDRSNLLLVTDNINQSKGAKGPSGFLPVKSFQCEYARIWKSVAEKYSLKLPDRDNAKIRNILKRC
jgi:5-methylcytosine-specific restriction endonuclease McrA